MPKGVEHVVDEAHHLSPPLVQLSVMPKGVEHIVSGKIPLAPGRVQLSVMPKGVEHAARRAPASCSSQCNYQ